MHLVEIDHLALQAPQTVLALLTNRSSGEVLTRFAICIPAKTALRKDVRPLAFPLLQRLRDDFFGMTGAVDGGDDNPIDTQFDGAHDGRDEIRSFLFAPGKFP